PAVSGSGCFRGVADSLCELLWAANELDLLDHGQSSKPDYASFQHPQGRQADRRTPRWRDVVPLGSVLHREAVRRHDALRHRGPQSRWEHDLRQYVRGLRDLAGGDEIAPGWSEGDEHL